jgi:hypothetical protein
LPQLLLADRVDLSTSPVLVGVQIVLGVWLRQGPEDSCTRYWTTLPEPAGPGSYS